MNKFYIYLLPAVGRKKYLYITADPAVIINRIYSAGILHEEIKILHEL
jgi:hypothetical protein